MLKKHLLIEKNHFINLYVQNDNRYEKITHLDSSLYDASLDRINKIFLNFSKDEENWISDFNKFITEKTDNFLTRSNNFERIRTENYQSGVCGLQNLGNTCFMNSALQCLSNVRHLTEYFMNKSNWTADINTTNVLGAKGDFAKCYAELISEMWSGRNTSFCPRLFKTYVAKIAPQFSGYNQHDSQELMNAVLDGLHEDLNRIKTKPYIEKKDAEGRSDQEVADESWEIHKKRNDSIIVDLFYGLLKSNVTCPVCNYVSLTFDPYVCLTLPIGDSCITYQLVYIWPNVREKSFSCRLLKVILKINGTANKRTIAEALQLVRPAQENYSYSICVNPDPTCYSQNSQYAFAFELPNGEPVKVKFRNAKDSEIIGNEFFLNLPNNSSSGRQVLATPSLIEAQIRSLFSNLGLDNMVDFDQLSNYNKNSTTTDNGDTEFKDANDDSNDDDVENGCKMTEDPLQIFIYQLSRECSLNQFAKNQEINVDKIIIEINDEHLADRIEEISSIQHAQPLLPKDAEGQDFARVKGYIVHDRKVDIYDSFDKFITAEKLSNMNMWFCKKCKADREAFKKLDIWTLPDILVLHLKRFKGSHRYSKDSTLVDYPVNGLDLTKYIRSNEAGKEYIYDLTGVSSHSGNLGFGHYTAYAKNFKNNTWYLFNDSSTSAINSGHVVDNSAYILVYERRQQCPEKADEAVEFYSDPAVVTSESSSHSQHNNNANNSLVKAQIYS